MKNTVSNSSKLTRKVERLNSPNGVLLCHTNLRKAMIEAERLSATWRMAFNASKCGVMGFQGTAHKIVQSSARGVQINGNTMRVVNRYVYLGAPFILALDK